MHRSLLQVCGTGSDPYSHRLHAGKYTAAVSGSEASVPDRESRDQRGHVGLWDLGIRAPGELLCPFIGFVGDPILIDNIIKTF